MLNFILWGIFFVMVLILITLTKIIDKIQEFEKCLLIDTSAININVRDWMSNSRDAIEDISFKISEIEDAVKYLKDERRFGSSYDPFDQNSNSA